MNSYYKRSWYAMKGVNMWWGENWYLGFAGGASKKISTFITAGTWPDWMTWGGESRLAAVRQAVPAGNLRKPRFCCGHVPAHTGIVYLVQFL